MNHLVNQIKVSGFKGGTLRFYGQWYGRPYDNFHRFINATSEGNCLILSLITVTSYESGIQRKSQLEQA